MRVFGVVGFKNSGKTTLACALISALSERGYAVASIKRAHHGVDFDEPGRDSHRHRKAGARQILVAAGSRVLSIDEGRGRAAPKLEDLLARLEAVDFVLVEGFKRAPFPKIECRRRDGAPGPLLAATDPHIFAIASDHALEDPPAPRFSLDDVAALADLAVAKAGAPTPPGAPTVGDCFSLDAGMVTVDEAHRIVGETARAWFDERRPAIETTPLAGSIGRILSRDLTAPRDAPASDNAGVDGWAFAWSAAIGEKGAALPIAPGRAAAGAAYPGVAPPGQALRILTGAPTPAGVDSIALQERCRVEDSVVHLPKGLKRNANIRPKGEDMRAGERVLAAGTLLRPQDLGAAALQGLAALSTRRRLRVAIASTGDELAQPGEDAPPSAVYDANRPILRALFDQPFLEVVDLGALPDDAGAIEAALAQAGRACDLLVTSGGASQGDEDHAAAAAKRLGQLEFWRVALKPGRPLAFGRIGDALYLGLPGNPVAASLCAMLFALPMARAMAGGPYRRPAGPRVALGFAKKKLRGRTEYVRVALDQDQKARLIEKQGSGVLTSLVEADGVIELAADLGDVEAGFEAPYLGFERLARGG